MRYEGEGWTKREGKGKGVFWFSLGSIPAPPLKALFFPLINLAI